LGPVTVILMTRKCRGGDRDYGAKSQQPERHLAVIGRSQRQSAKFGVANRN